MTILNRWQRKASDLLSPVSSINILPTSWTNFFPSLHQGPILSTAIGTKMYWSTRFLYLFFFFEAAISATLPASLLANLMLEGARVSVQVASHTIHFPFFQGIMLIPSGRLPSSLMTPTGSMMILQ
uniref:Uncharacterized protein n=1 Tax=Cacopsylla melanoneura TaxID=428564 RepID=A0A8D8UQ24_9HEMI